MMISPGGIDPKTWNGASKQFADARRGFDELRSSGSVGFVDLGGNKELLGQVERFAAGARGKYDDVVVLGIGGSALGPIALRTALRPSGWNMLDDKARGGFPRLQVLDNVDPRDDRRAAGTLSLRAHCSSSRPNRAGRRRRWRNSSSARPNPSRKLDVAKHLVFVTDPKQGALRPLAERLKVPALDIPPSVGGRFSVLTPVGTLPAALIGIDVQSLLAGAGEMARRCANAELGANPAGVYAILQWLSDTQLKKSIAVFMPYSDPLRDFAAWFVQPGRRV
jgi:glucose-6-phosphate isomerase